MDEEEAAEVSLQLVFFDGEEAFQTWTDDDSVYGSRYLAQTWEDTLLPDNHAFQKRRMGGSPTMLDTMDVLVLLDLLGAAYPRMMSFYPDTEWLFRELASADAKLRTAGLVDKRDDKWFSPGASRQVGIDDDHRPFKERGVPILHLIPVPFPSVWHSMAVSYVALIATDARTMPLPSTSHHCEDGIESCASSPLHTSVYPPMRPKSRLLIDGASWCVTSTSSA